MGDFLLLLNQAAQPAAAGQGDIGQTAALEVVLCADVGALQGHGDPVEADAGRAAEEEALFWEGVVSWFVMRGVDEKGGKHTEVLMGS